MTGDIESPDQARALLRTGYDGVVVGNAAMRNADAHKFISIIRDWELLPAHIGDLDIETADLKELILCSKTRIAKNRFIQKNYFSD